MNTINLTAGVGLMVVTGVAYCWGIPNDGETSRVPNRFGLRVMFPIAVMVAGIVSIVLTVKGIYP